MENQIIIDQSYFDNIRVAIDSINNYFISNYEKKNFPLTEPEESDYCISDIIGVLKSIDASWIKDPSNAEKALEDILSVEENIEPDENFFTYCADTNDESLHIEGERFAAYKILQFISEHQEEFTKLINAVYSFDLFLHPSEYKHEVELFENIPMEEASEVFKDAKIGLFDLNKYVTYLFDNEKIKFPEGMDGEAEAQRVTSFKDSGAQVAIDENFQEAAAVNYFTDEKPSNIKYDKDSNKWVISTQFEKTVDGIVEKIKSCETTDDLNSLFTDEKSKSMVNISDTVVPFILAKVFVNSKKYPFDIDAEEKINKYNDSYKSIVNKNNGAKRFQNYDIFSTFKADKQGTVKFIEDFLKLKLVNDEKAVITNNTILTLFNIFDSRIYLDIMYNMIPDEVKEEKKMDEDSFVKQIRARINKNSRESNPYDKNEVSEEPDNSAETPESVNEYCTSVYKSLGSMDISDMVHCEAWIDAVKSEINCMDDIMYNKNLSSDVLDKYIGESYSLFINESNTDDTQHTVDVVSETVTPSFDESINEFFTSVIASATNSDKRDLTDAEIVCANKFLMESNFDTDTSSIETGIVDKNGKNVRMRITSTHTFRTDDMIDGSRRKQRIQEVAQTCDSIPNEMLSIIKEMYSNPSFLYNEIFGEVIQETDKGAIPEYMKTRIDLSDETGKDNKPKVEDVDVPSETPSNDISDLADSVDSRFDDSNSDDIKDVLGKEAPKPDGKQVIYNITNNYSYTNSFNRDSSNRSVNYDLSSNKTVDKSTKRSSTDLSHKTYDLSSNKGSNNISNSNESRDTDDSKNKIKQEFSTGYTFEDLITFMESDEPLSNDKRANKPPKDTLLTKSMDKDREKRSKKQEAKKRTGEIIGTVKAATKPITRTKQWLLATVDSLIKRREEDVKADIIKNPSYRTALFKAMRIGLKLGLTGVCFTINTYLGAAYLLLQASNIADKNRLKKEVQREMTTELEILDDKIEEAKATGDKQAQWKMMRLRSKMESIVTKEAIRSNIRHTDSVN